MAQWLAAHPGVAILSRDHSGAYADGARPGAPAALQVAHRFPLLRNLAALLIALSARHQTALQQATGGLNRDTLPVSLQNAVLPPTSETPAIPVPAPITVPALPTTALTRAWREQHLKNYVCARKLHQQGWTCKPLVGIWASSASACAVLSNHRAFPTGAGRSQYSGRL